ncbi:MAG: type II toxin-antitoxin system Phd/YefM family antitoxin [Candidatus Parabeggiatoa sp.]|nr:type II toxin-antitoxin system Phd/YefM family antitoxin [Candidatus Parabeggiatoa sp.]
MHEKWQIKKAKNQFNLLIKQAGAGNPQFITRHGKPVVVVLSFPTYEKLNRSADKLSSVLLAPEIGGDDLDFSRDQDSGRDIKL